MNLEKGICHIVMACDEAYAMPVATALRSIVEANRCRQPLAVHVLSHGVSVQVQERVLDSLPSGSISLQWVPVDLERFGGFATVSYISRMTYARFLIPYVFSDTVTRVLYLDADILVLDDLGSLCETDLQGAPVGAVIDGLDTALKEGKTGLDAMPRVRNYFNAGVLLIDLRRWREERISERALDYLNRHPRSPFADQDALNVACDGVWHKLDPRWNYQDHHLRRTAVAGMHQPPGIIHFVTSLKPWDASLLNPNAGLYDTYRARTQFARTNRDKLRDSVKSDWSRFKQAVKRYPVSRSIWKELSNGGPGVRP